jgi:hypothetical protein
LVPFGGERGIEQGVIATGGHGRESFLPPRARVLCGANDKLRSADFHFDLVAEAGLLKKRLGNANSAGVADLNQIGSHNYIVITLNPLVNPHTSKISEDPQFDLV